MRGGIGHDCTGTVYHEVVVGTQTAATNVWKGQASFNELRDGQTILYWLPYAGTTSGATLELTLGDGSTTGPLYVYINGSTRCTNHIAVGNITMMTYRENTPINGKGSYTGWWITRNQDTTTNYYDRINYKAVVTAAEVIEAQRIGVFNAEGKLILLSARPFDVTKPILFTGTKFSTTYFVYRHEVFNHSPEADKQLHLLGNRFCCGTHSPDLYRHSRGNDIH